MELDLEEQLRRYGEAVERWLPQQAADHPTQSLPEVPTNEVPGDPVQETVELRLPAEEPSDPARRWRHGSRRRRVRTMASVVGAAAVISGVVVLWPRDTTQDRLETDVPAGPSETREAPATTEAPTTSRQADTATPSETTTSAPNREPEPASAVRPGPDTTGPTDTSVLEPVTGEEVEAMMRPGAVIENVDITGGNIDVVADDVTIRNFRLDAGGAPFGFRSCGSDTECSSPDQSDGFVAEDGEILNTSVAAFRGSHATLRRLEVHDSDGGAFVVVTGVTIEGSWWHHLGRAEGASANGVRFARYSAGAQSDIQIRGNHCDMPVSVPPPYNSSACVIVGSDVDVASATVEGNWLNGGNHTVECNNQSGVAVRDNRFGRRYRTGPLSRCPNSSGNVWDDTDELLSATRQGFAAGRTS